MSEGHHPCSAIRHLKLERQMPAQGHQKSSYQLGAIQNNSRKGIPQPELGFVNHVQNCPLHVLLLLLLLSKVDAAAGCRMVSFCTDRLPPDKPRYVMGIGYPLDVVICSALGADMYDSVYPTRTARFGVALVPDGVLKLKTAACANDFRYHNLVVRTSCCSNLCQPCFQAGPGHTLEGGISACAMYYQQWMFTRQTFVH